MNDLALTLAINDYDHVRDLVSGRVKPEGISLNCLQLQVEEIFYRFGAFQEWDVSELSMGMYCAAASRGEPPFVAIPVFPSRVFRQSSIFVRRGGPVSSLADLRGKRVGLPMWTQTACVYVRGYIQHQGGIALQEIDWVQSGVNDAGRKEPSKIELPSGVNVSFDNERSLTQLLLDKDIDAMLSALPPRAFLDGDTRIRRLFPNYRKVETAYFKETGIFPIMHTIAIKRDVFERNRWIAKNLMTAFAAAKQRSLARLRSMATSQIALPWGQDVTDGFHQALFPDSDYWPYGVAANRATLQTFLDYCFEQGVTARALTPEELFPEEARFELKI